MRDSFVDGSSCQEGCSNLNNLYNCGEQKSISHRPLQQVSEQSEDIVYHLFIHPTWTVKAIFKLK